MKNQALFSSKGESTKLKCLLLQFLFGALRVNLVYLGLIQFTQIFSSPEPKAPGELIGWEGSVVRPSSVRPQFQTTSLKLLGQLQLNFIYSLQGL